MDVVDILISIVVVTILVTIILAIVTYIAYKLRLAREPATQQDDPNALRYFVRYDSKVAQAGQTPGGTSDESHEAESERPGVMSDPTHRGPLDPDIAAIGEHAARA
jgi:hypothetical protein